MKLRIDVQDERYCLLCRNQIPHEKRKSDIAHSLDTSYCRAPCPNLAHITKLGAAS